jgi:hypothetical protein
MSEQKLHYWIEHSGPAAGSEDAQGFLIVRGPIQHWTVSTEVVAEGLSAEDVGSLLVSASKLAAEIIERNAAAEEGSSWP